MTAGPARSIARAGGLRRPFALRGRRGPCAPRWGRGATEQEQSDHEAHRTGDHKDHARGLDREPGHGRFNCKRQDRAKRDQEYRCSDRHRSHRPGTVGNKRGRLAGTSFLGRANLGSSLPSCLLDLRGLIGRAPILCGVEQPGHGADQSAVQLMGRRTQWVGRQIEPRAASRKVLAALPTTSGTRTRAAPTRHRDGQEEGWPGCRQGQEDARLDPAVNRHSV
jgi:hypothetical protein